MASKKSSARRKNKRSRKHRRSGNKRSRASGPGVAILMGVDPDNREISRSKGSLDATLDYLAMHENVPEDIAGWGHVELDGLVEHLLQTRCPGCWKKGLINLAHHRSQRALDLLEILREGVPGPAREFYRYAVDEARGWLDMASAEQATASTV